MGASLLVACALVACSSGGGSESSGEQFVEGDVAQPRPQATVAPQAANIFRDDFSSSGTGWDVVDRDDFASGYGDGKYRITAKKPNLFGVSSTAYEGPSDRPDLKQLGPVRLGITASTGSTGPATAGLACRTAGAANALELYGGTIDTDGKWKLFRWGPQGASDLASGDGGGAALKAEPLRLSLDCEGAPGQPVHLRLSVGGHALGEADDPAPLAPGGVGFIAANREVPSVVLVFDDLLVEPR